MPLKKVLANAPKAGQLAIAKQNWEKVTSDTWVLQTVQGYSLELVTVPTQSSPPAQVHLPGDTYEGGEKMFIDDTHIDNNLLLAPSKLHRFQINDRRTPSGEIGQNSQSGKEPAGPDIHNERDLAQFIGRANSATLAIPPAPLFYRAQQGAKHATVTHKRDLDSAISMTNQEREELLWWVEQAKLWNGSSLKPLSHFLKIQTDASKLGWGAVCHGVRTGGPWTYEENQFHINYLELLAAFLGIQLFLKLHPGLFQRIVKTFGTIEVDLFASRLTYQVPGSFSWKPDPQMPSYKDGISFGDMQIHHGG